MRSDEKANEITSKPLESALKEKSGKEYLKAIPKLGV
jgi:hypothetical protein